MITNHDGIRTGRTTIIGARLSRGIYSNVFKACHEAVFEKKGVAFEEFIKNKGSVAEPDRGVVGKYCKSEIMICKTLKKLSKKKEGSNKLEGNPPVHAPDPSAL